MSLSQARARLRTLVMMFKFIGLGLALAPGLRDLGPVSRVYNSSGSGSEMANGRSSSPMTARRASKCSVESYPKSTADDVPTGFEILSRQKVKHVEADE